MSVSLSEIMGTPQNNKTTTATITKFGLMVSLYPSHTITETMSSAISGCLEIDYMSASIKWDYAATTQPICEMLIVLESSFIRFTCVHCIPSAFLTSVNLENGVEM